MNTIITNILLGGALGDALGAPHELVTYRGEYTGNLQYNIKINNRYYGMITLNVGSVTDDTQMTFVLLRSLIKHKGLNKEDLILSYITWADIRHESLGHNTRALFRNIKTKNKIRSYYTRRNKVDPNNQSNGSLMRTCSLAFLPLSLTNEELFNIIREEVNITNQHENNVMCSILHVSLLRMVIRSLNEDTIKQELIEFVKVFMNDLSDECEDLQVALNDALKQKKRTISDKSKGWCCNSMYCSILALVSCNSYKEGINLIISLGGDVDIT